MGWLVSEIKEGSAHLSSVTVPKGALWPDGSVRVVVVQHKKSRLADIRDVARRMLADERPPPTFREALALYRQLMAGGCVFWRCRFDGGGE